MDPEAILDTLDAVRAQTLARLDGLTQAELDWRPPNGQGEWSLGEIFMHLAIDEFYLRELIARPLLEGITPPDGVTFLPPPPPHGARKETIVFWFERARKGTRQMVREWPAQANLSAEHCGGLGEGMNGAAWLHAYGGHERFHHQQIDALTAKLPQRTQTSFLQRIDMPNAPQ